MLSFLLLRKRHQFVFFCSFHESYNILHGGFYIVTSCKSYYAATGRRISFEYTLIAGKNDSREAALALAALLNAHLRSPRDTMPIHVNLIPVNPVTETGFSSSERKTVEQFAATLEKKGIRATVRRRLGADINASCGQLRREEEGRK